MATELLTDAEAAARRRGAGVDVILILAEGVALPAEPGGAGAAGLGRLAVFVDSAGADDVAAAGTGGGAEALARAMGAELWGP